MDSPKEKSWHGKLQEDLEELQDRVREFQSQPFPKLVLPKLSKRKKRRRHVRTLSPACPSPAPIVPPSLVPKAPRKFGIVAAVPPLGPGYYYPREVQSHSGGYLPGLQQQTLDQLLNERSTSSGDFTLRRQIYERDRDLDQHKPQQRRVKNKEKAQSMQVRLEIQKTAKMLVDRRQHQHRIAQLQKKLDRMELFARRSELSGVQKSWAGLLAALGSGLVIYHHARRWTHMRARSQLHLGVLLYVSLFVGKAAAKLRQRRVQRCSTVRTNVGPSAIRATAAELGQHSKTEILATARLCS